MSTLQTILNRYNGNSDIMMGADGKPLSVSWADELLADQLIKLMDKVDALEKQNADLQNKLDANMTAIDLRLLNHARLFPAIQDKIDALGTLVGVLDEKLATLKRIPPDVESTLWNHHQRLDNHWGQIEILTDLILDLQKRCPSKMGASVQENQDQIDGLEQSFQQMTGQLMSLQSVVRHLSQILDNNMKYSIQVAQRDMGHLTNLKILINNLQGSLNKNDQGIQGQIDELSDAVQGVKITLADLSTKLEVESRRVSDVIQQTGTIPF